MNAGVSARELGRSSVTNAIKDAARRRLAAQGAARLSVRAVARDIGMVSSAVYRYFPTRDELLTALIIDAYDAIGAAVERADRGVPAPDLRGRWRAMCGAIRSWARKHPHEYGLIYGAPIPDYRAPRDTVGPAARVPVALLSVLEHGWTIGAIHEPSPTSSGTVTTALGHQLQAVAADLGLTAPPSLLLRFAVAWTQLFGMVTFELFGQLVGTLEPADDFFSATVDLMADFAGIE
jgi:AcrR family transcriptional regulator